MSVQIPKLTENLNIHQTLADQPTLSSSDLKIAWDSPANKIKTYLNTPLNDALVEAFDDIEDELEDALNEIRGLLDDIKAEDVSYDNTTSGLEATNVQSAIDELNSITGDLSSGMSGVNTNLAKKSVYGDFVVTTISRYDSLAPSAPTSREQSFTITENKAGYIPIGIVGFHYVKSDVDSELLRYELTTKSNGRAVVTYKLKLNNTLDTTGHTLYFNILWVKVR